MGHAVDLPEASVVLDERRGFLLVSISGQLSTVTDVERFLGILRDGMSRFGLDKVLLDLRDCGVPLPDDACQRAWHAIHERSYNALACALPASVDMMVTRINMTALSSNLPFRAFGSITDAHRWLDTRLSGVQRRMSSTSTVPPAVGRSNTLRMSTVSPAEVAAYQQQQQASSSPPPAQSSVPPRTPPHGRPKAHLDPHEGQGWVAPAVGRRRGSDP